MAHVRMQVDRQLFGEVMDDFAYSLRGSCVSVKEELRRPQRGHGSWRFAARPYSL